MTRGRSAAGRGGPLSGARDAVLRVAADPAAHAAAFGQAAGRSAITVTVLVSLDTQLTVRPGGRAVTVLLGLG